MLRFLTDIARVFVTALYNPPSDELHYAGHQTTHAEAVPIPSPQPAWLEGEDSVVYEKIEELECLYRNVRVSGGVSEDINNKLVLMKEAYDKKELNPNVHATIEQLTSYLVAHQDKYHPLILAATYMNRSFGCHRIFEALLAHRDINPNLKNDFSLAAIHVLAGRLVDPKNNQSPPYDRFASMMDKLLAHEATDPHIETYSGDSAIVCAIQHDNRVLFEKLAKHPKTNLTRRYKGKTLQAWITPKDPQNIRGALAEAMGLDILPEPIITPSLCHVM